MKSDILKHYVSAGIPKLLPLILSIVFASVIWSNLSYHSVCQEVLFSIINVYILWLSENVGKTSLSQSSP